MEIEERLSWLEEAVRSLARELIEQQKITDALAADFMALEQANIALLPLISAPEPVIRRVLLLAYDGLNDKLESKDTAFRMQSLQALEVISSVILDAAGIRDQIRRGS